MTGKRSFRASWRRSGREPQPEPNAQPEPDVAAIVDEAADPTASEAATIQVLAHGLIADLYGAGLRVQSIANRAPEELQDELETVTDQIDKVIAELRSFAFRHRD